LRIEKKNSSDERRILIGMIVDPIVLGRIFSRWQHQMFRSRWANIIAKWCLRYYKRYNKAPLAQIESLYETWAAESKDKTVIRLVEKFLDSLSAEYEDLQSESNSDYIIDVAGRYFNQVRIEMLMESVESDIDGGKVDKAHDRLVGYSKIEMGVGEGIDILQNEEAMQKAFADRGESLIKFSGALGEFFGDSLEREGFIAFMGKKGIGKSWWLQEVSYQAMLQRRRVVMFEVGDMGESQMMRRLGIRITRHPRYPKVIRYPVGVKWSVRRNRAVVEFDEREFGRKLSWRRAIKACKRVVEKSVKSKDTYFLLSCHINSTLHVSGIQNILQDWAREDWVPDVIVIDYADILNMEYQGIEGQDRINETWKRLRGLSQQYHCLLVTATQSDAASYDKNTMGMGNFSDDRRKIDSVTGMIGISQTPAEKKNSLMRLNWISLRDAEFHTNRCVHVAGCLAIGNPAMKSCF